MLLARDMRHFIYNNPEQYMINFQLLGYMLGFMGQLIDVSDRVYLEHQIKRSIGR